MDSASEKRIRETLRQLKTALESGDIPAFRDRLDQSASPEILGAAREGKLLLKAPPGVRLDAAQALADVGERVLSPVESGTFTRHLNLLGLIAPRAAACQAAIDRLVPDLPLMCLADLLSISQKTLSRAAGRFMDADRHWYDPSRPVGLVERDWHDLNGRMADVSSAVCRAVNAASARLDERPRLRDERRAKAERTFGRLVILCSIVNGLDWVRDSASFGDFDVTEIRAGAAPVVELEFRDARRSLLRTLGTRRKVVMDSFARRRTGFVGEWLARNSDGSFRNAAERYRRTVRTKSAPEPDAVETSRPAELHLNSLDFDDDLIVMASDGDPRVLGRYLLSSLLQWSEIAAAGIARHLPKSASRRFLPAPIALEDLLGDLDDPTWRDVLREAWLEASIELPATNHWDLVRRPFVRESRSVARPLLHGATSKWNATVRERLLRGGALAKTVGASWETYFGDRFREGGWDVIGQGVRLRADGAILTDVDLLVVRDDLLLIVQVKALGGSALNPYDHWKYRKVIEKGCWQAGVARRHLDSDRTLVTALAGRRVADRISHVEPVVLTNLSLFDGWEHGGVPVLGETLLKSITVGSKVDYVDPLQDRVVHTRHLLRAADLTTATIIDALRSPIELAIAPETGAVTHITEKVMDITFLVPDFAIDPARGGPVLAVPGIPAAPR